MTTERLIYSVPQAAEILGVSKGTLYHLCQRGQFPSVRLGRRVVIPKRVVDALLETGRLPEGETTAADLMAEFGRRAHEEPASGHALRREVI